MPDTPVEPLTPQILRSRADLRKKSSARDGLIHPLSSSLVVPYAMSVSPDAAGAVIERYIRCKVFPVSVGYLWDAYREQASVLAGGQILIAGVMRS